MDRAFLSGASGTPPAAPASPSIGYPTAGNPGTGTPPTYPGPYWFHMLEEELLAIVVAAGITPAQGTLTQLLTALRSAGVFTTPAQFDSTTKAATTAFVQRALGSNSGSASLTANTTLNATYIGKMISLVSASAFTVTLPLAASLPDGATLEFANLAAGTVTIQRQGAENIVAGAANITSFPIGLTDRVNMKVVSGTWVLGAGSAQLPFSNLFQSTLAGAGYQKLPSGLIVQWTSANTAASGRATGSWPIAFPNALLRSWCSVGGYSAVAGFHAGIGTGVSATIYDAWLSNASAGFGINFLAVGN